MRLQIDRGGGKVDELDVDLTTETMTMREQERFNAVAPPAAVAALAAGNEADPTPGLFLAIVYAKLYQTPYRDIPYEAIDFNLDELASFAETDEEKAWVEEAIVLPMETPDGQVTEGHG